MQRSRPCVQRGTHTSTHTMCAARHAHIYEARTYLRGTHISRHTEARTCHTTCALSKRRQRHLVGDGASVLKCKCRMLMCRMTCHVKCRMTCDVKCRITCHTSPVSYAKHVLKCPITCTQVPYLHVSSSALSTCVHVSYLPVPAPCRL